MKNLNSNLIAAALVIAFALGLAAPIFALAASPQAVNLGTAGNFVILSKTGVSTTGSTLVVGDIGISPAAASYVTGFALTLPAAGAFSTSAEVTGKIYAPGYADPTPASLSAAVLDMQTAYTDAAGRAAGVTELGAGNIGGLTLAAGVYKWSTGVTIPTNITLSGSAGDVWIFQIAQNLDVSSSVQIALSGGAQAGNIFWQVAGQTTIGTGAVFNGNILDQTAVVVNTGATLNGRALAQTAVTLDSNSVTIPSGSVMPPAPTPAPTPSPSPSPTPTPSPSPSPAAAVSCDPFPAGFTAVIVNNACVYIPIPTPNPAPIPANSPWANGSLIKGDNSATVYMVVNGELKPFTSAGIFFARDLKFSDVTTVPASQISSAVIDTPVIYPDGSLIKGSGATVYIVMNGQKSGIPSVAVFNRLGLSFNNVINLSDAEVASYPETAIQQ